MRVVKMITLDGDIPEQRLLSMLADGVHGFEGYTITIKTITGTPGTVILDADHRYDSEPVVYDDCD